MIVLLIALWSLCAVYFTILLHKKGMKVAPVLVTVLYAYVLVWIYLLFFIDVGDVGFNLTEMHESSVYCGDVYRAFNQISVRMNGLSDNFLYALSLICTLIAVSAVGVILIGSIRFTREVRRIVRSCEGRFTNVHNEQGFMALHVEYKTVPLIKRYCRANC